MEILLSSTQKTKDLAGKVAGKLKPGDVLALYGDLGSGKTTFVNFLVDSLGIPARVQSPTFVLHRKYTGGSGDIKVVNHIDLYRITKLEETNDLGLDEIFTKEDSVAVIEWPELVENILPKKTTKIYFDYVSKNERKAKIQNLP